MAAVELILLQRVEKLGQMGDVVKVKPGFARNFLLPQKKALRASKDNLASLRAAAGPARGAEPQAPRGSRTRGRTRGRPDRRDHPPGRRIRQPVRVGVGARYLRCAHRGRADDQPSAGDPGASDQDPRPGEGYAWRCIRKCRSPSPSTSPAARRRPNGRSRRTGRCRGRGGRSRRRGRRIRCGPAARRAVTPGPTVTAGSWLAGRATGGPQRRTTGETGGPPLATTDETGGPSLGNARRDRRKGRDEREAGDEESSRLPLPSREGVGEGDARHDLPADVPHSRRPLPPTHSRKGRGSCLRFA